MPVSNAAQTPKDRLAARTVYVLLALILVLTLLVYLPGLSGGFIFDDFGNLALLGYYGVIDNFQSLWLYILSGFAGPTGRPLSLASFLVDARDWPAEPGAFKRTNVLIHLLVGSVLFGFIRELAKTVQPDRAKATQVALFATALWILHPLWVSTTLYVVQRMTQLSALFVLLGLWAYVRIRLRNPMQAKPRIVIQLSGTIVFFSILATLSKENGALLVLLVLTLEATILGAYDRRLGRLPTTGFIWWRRAILGVPAAILLAYFSLRVGAFFSTETGARAFTPLERLLTQGRILWDYVFHLFVPHVVTGGVFQDHIRVSTSVFNPITTFIAWLAWAIVLAGAVFVRKKRPVVSAAILFFFVGHSMESIFIHLELYFEHRNYLPAMLLGLPLALGWLNISFQSKITTAALPVALVLLLSASTLQRADIWGDPFRQAVAWAEKRHDSPRAQSHLADIYLEMGDRSEARRLLSRAIELDPQGLPWLIGWFFLSCEKFVDPVDELKVVTDAIRSLSAVGSVQRLHVRVLLDGLYAGECVSWPGHAETLAVIDDLENHLDGRVRTGLASIFDFSRGHVYLSRGDVSAAVGFYESALGERPRPGQVLAIAARIASDGFYEDALVLLEDAPPNVTITGRPVDRIRIFFQKRTGYYEREVLELKRSIQEAIEDRDPQRDSL